MIKPDRHTNPDNSAINVSAVILSHLNEFYDITYDELSAKVIKALGKEARENFPYALDFLYLLGKVEYIEQSDSFIYHAAT